MADPRLELLRRFYEGFAAMDPEAVSEVWHPDCEWHIDPTRAFVSKPVFRGYGGTRGFITTIAEAAESVDAQQPVE